MATALTPVKTTRATDDIAVPVEQVESAADVAGNNFPNTGRELLYVRNVAGANKTLIVTDRAGNALATRTLTDTKTSVIGPFRVDRYNDASGNVNFTINSASVKVTVVTIDHAGVLAPSQS